MRIMMRGKHHIQYSHCYLWDLEDPCFLAALGFLWSLEDLAGHPPLEHPAELTAECEFFT